MKNKTKQIILNTLGMIGIILGLIALALLIYKILLTL